MFGYGYHLRFVTKGAGVSFNCQKIVLYFATEDISNTPTCIKIEIPALGYVENISNILVGTIVRSDPIPKSGAAGRQANLPVPFFIVFFAYLQKNNVSITDKSITASGIII